MTSNSMKVVSYAYAIFFHTVRILWNPGYLLCINAACDEISRSICTIIFRHLV